jgi:hypothetical protein
MLVHFKPASILVVLCGLLASFGPAGRTPPSEQLLALGQIFKHAQSQKSEGLFSAFFRASLINRIINNKQGKDLAKSERLLAWRSAARRAKRRQA